MLLKYIYLYDREGKTEEVERFTTLAPLNPSDLVSEIVSAGFVIIHKWGGYSKEEFTENSPKLLILAIRPA